MHFKHQYLFLGDVQGTDGPIHCSTFPILEEQFVDMKNRCPLVKVTFCKNVCCTTLKYYSILVPGKRFKPRWQK